MFPLTLTFQKCSYPEIPTGIPYTFWQWQLYSNSWAYNVIFLVIPENCPLLKTLHFIWPTNFIRHFKFQLLRLYRVYQNTFRVLLCTFPVTKWSKYILFLWFETWLLCYFYSHHFAFKFFYQRLLSHELNNFQTHLYSNKTQLGQNYQTFSLSLKTRWCQFKRREPIRNKF